MNAIQLLNKKVQVIDPEDEYALLVGTVREIHLLNTPKHDTENDTDDIVVDLDEEQRPLLPAYHAELSENYDDLAAVPLDSTIFSPDQLRIID